MKHTIFTIILTALLALGSALNAAAAQVPFEPTKIVNGQFADDTQWYSIYVRQNKYLSVSDYYFFKDGESQVSCDNSKQSITADDNNFLWAFVEDGGSYRIYNRAIGTAYCLGFDNVADHEYPTFSTSGHPYNTFTFVQSNNTANAGFVLSPAGYDLYLNDLSGYGILALWNSKSALSSAGSCMVFEEVDTTGGGGGGTVDPEPTNDFYDTLSQLVNDAHDAYDANSIYSSVELLRSASQLYSDYSQNDLGNKDGDGLEALIDNDPSTYWHSYWEGGTVSYGTYHSIRCTAPEDLGAFEGDLTVSITQRLTGSHHPTLFRLYGTNSLSSGGGGWGGGWGGNTTSWTEIGTLEFSYGGPGSSASDRFTLTKPYKYLRFDCTATEPTSSWKGYFHLAELHITGQEQLLPSCPNAVYADEAQALADAISRAESILDDYLMGRYDITQDDIDALNNALDTYLNAIPTLVTAVEVAPSSFTTYTIGEQLALTASVIPADASNPALRWDSSDPNVASVSPDGVVTTTGIGDCFVTATSTDGTNISGSCYVTVASLDDFASLCINEVQVANIDQYLDPSRNYSGWVELYNPTNRSINLGGLYVGGTDSKGVDEVLFRLCDDYGSVPARGFRNIWFDHYAVYDNKVDDARKQVYWKLDSEGGTVRLLAADASTVLCQLTYPAAVPRSSYARTTDGGDTWGWHPAGTPQASNNGLAYLDTPQRLDAPVVSCESQVTTASSVPFTVEIPDGCTLYYTTNYSTPTANSAISRDGVFTARGTQTFRFRLFKEGYLPSPVVTRSFINNKDRKAPIMVVSTDNDNLTSSDHGIFTTYSSYGRDGAGATSSNRNMDWERPVNFEYFDLTAEGDYQCVLNQEADINVCGGWTRHSGSTPSFKIKAAEQYEGMNYLEYPIFKTKPYNKNRTLQMRTESDLADVGIQEIARRSGLNIDTQGWQPCQVYINGTSRGYFPIREPNNKHFALANYGIPSEEIDAFEIDCDSNYVQSVGTREAFDRWYELADRCSTDEAAYRELLNLVDVEEYFNYMAIELYCGNNDWPWNNFKGFRSRNDGKFHIVLMDVGHRICRISNAFDNLREYRYKAYRAWNGNETPVCNIFFNMMRHPALRRRFIDSYLLVAYSVYDPAYVEEIRQQLVTELNGVLNTSGSTLTSNFTSSRQSTMLYDLLNCKELEIDRNSQFTIAFGTNLPEARLHLNGLPVPRQTFDGTLLAPVTLTAEAPEGYEFVGWQDQYGNIVCPDTEWTITEGYYNSYGRVTAVYNPVNQLVGRCPIRINEVSAANDIYVNEYWSRRDWIELYNTSDHDIDVAGMYLSDDTAKPHKWQIPAQGEPTLGGLLPSAASTVVPAHGTLIVWADKDPAGTQLHAPFKLSNADGCSVTIAASDDAWTDCLTYKAHSGLESYGRYPDGAQRIYHFTLPSIDASNRLASFSRPTEPDGPTPTTVDFELAAGWNWFSHPFGEAQPVELFTDGAQLIRSQKDELVNDATYGWVGTLTTIEPGQAYKVQYDAPRTVSLTGVLYDTEAAPVSLKAGWNWVGCPLANPTEINAALSALAATEGDVIVGLDGFSTYTERGWLGTLRRLNPGEGYLLCTATSQQFNWTALSTVPSQRRMAREAADEPQLWPLDIHAYPNVMNLIGTLADSSLGLADDELATDPSTSLDGLTLAAFATADANNGLGECRALSTIVDGRFYLNIHGDNAERLTFAIVDASGQTFALKETLEFTPQQLVGSHATPFAFSLVGTTTVDDIARTDDILEQLIFTPAGQRLARLQSGVNIITTRYTNGRTVVRKVTLADER